MHTTLLDHEQLQPQDPQLPSEHTPIPQAHCEDIEHFNHGPFPVPTVSQHQFPRDPQTLQQDPSVHPYCSFPYQHASASLPKVLAAASSVLEV